ncbi:MAG: enoyl-CoA hydratase-related protein, partial [Chloroflexota bacterium]|nr:enoyl-CoA hydratase-related protein [Chloroflexota bacterium]
LSNVIEDIQHDEAVRAVVLTGAGRAFCAGGDVKDLLSQATDPVEMMDRSMEGAKLVAAMRNIPKPMIAAVNGPAVGAGCNLALACDIIIAAENASFSMAFISLGLHPDTGGIYFLTRLVGVARACELVFTGKAIGAQEAERIGLINQVVPAEQLESTVSELAGRLAKGPSKAIAMAKATIYQGLTMDMNSVLEAEVRAMSLSIATEDAKEGISAFLERRKPIFKGK